MSESTIASTLRAQAIVEDQFLEIIVCNHGYASAVSALYNDRVVYTFADGSKLIIDAAGEEAE